MNSSNKTTGCQTVIQINSVSARVPRETLPDGIGTIYRGSGNLFIIKNSCKAVPKQFIGCIRSDIVSFTAGSGLRMRRYLRECLADYRQMVTLTYPGFYETNGRAVKEHLKRFLQELRREYIRQHSDDGLHSSFWFLEFQFRGAPHFHIFTTWSPNKDWVSRTWYRIVGSDDIRHLHAGTRVEFLRAGRRGTISYASKYAQKQEQKEVPENYDSVGRFWGVTGRRATVSASTFVQANEMDRGEVKTAVKRVHLMLEKLFLSGNAEILYREQDVIVVNVHDYRDQVRLRSLVCRIAVQVSRYDQMFIDADIEFGEGNSNAYCSDNAA